MGDWIATAQLQRGSLFAGVLCRAPVSGTGGNCPRPRQMGLAGTGGEPASGARIASSAGASSDIRETCDSHGDVEVDTQGDAFFIAFARASDAVAAASDAQRGLAGGPIRVRMGLHSGSHLVTEEGYVGLEFSHEGRRDPMGGSRVERRGRHPVIVEFAYRRE